MAIADLEAPVAIALETIDAATTDAVARVAELVGGHAVDLVVIGKPTSLSGSEGPAVESMRTFARAVADATGVEIREHDERLTTVIVEKELRSAGVGADARKRVRDAAAARAILQSYLDSRR